MSQSAPRVQTITAAEAGSRFDEVMHRVAKGGGPVVVEEDGRPQVAIVSLEEFARGRSGQPERGDWQGKLDRARTAIAAELAGRPIPDMAELIREAREERDDQLLDLR